MNYVYKQKIFYFHLIKKTIISIILLIIIIELYSCSLHKVNSELTIKVTKVGTVESSKFIFIYPNSSRLSLKYKAILNKISQQLSEFGFCEVEDIKQANYAFAVILDNTFYNMNKMESSKYNNALLNSNTFYNLNDIREIFKKHDALLLEAYLINSENNYTKVMEGYTINTGKNTIISENDDKGYLGFVMCSISALFKEPKIFKSAEYQEYYYKCY